MAADVQQVPITTGGSPALWLPPLSLMLSVCVSDLTFCSKMAGEDIQGSTNEEVVSALSTITASGNEVSASLNLLQAFNPISPLS